MKNKKLKHLSLNLEKITISKLFLSSLKGGVGDGDGEIEEWQPETIKKDMNCGGTSYITQC